MKSVFPHGKVKRNPVMRKRLQIALMASTVAATSLSLHVRTPRRRRRGSFRRYHENHRQRRRRPQDLCERPGSGEQRRCHARVRNGPALAWCTGAAKKNRWKPVPAGSGRDASCALGGREVSQYWGMTRISRQPPGLWREFPRTSAPRRTLTAIERPRRGTTWTRTWCARW